MADHRRSKGTGEMSQWTQGSNDLGHTKSRKGERSRRSWSDREEEILILALKELVAQGWKSDNGFRAGYLTRLEEALRREFPATDLKVNPNIISKITAWKKSYYSFQTILSRSGVGFNINGDHKIDCDDDQWEQIVKMDGNAKFMRNKAWPYLDDWKEIFGKDRATGTGAEDILDAVNKLSSQDNIADLGVGSDYHVSFEDFLVDDLVDTSVAPNPAGDSTAQSGKDTRVPKRCSRKRKGRDEAEGILDLLQKMHEETNARLESLSTRMGYEFDLGKARQEVFDRLGHIPGLSLEQRFDVCEILGKESPRLKIFIGLPEAARPAYVMRVLEKQRGI